VPLPRRRRPLVLVIVFVAFVVATTKNIITTRFFKGHPFREPALAKKFPPV
jgi:hypothetical protein